MFEVYFNQKIQCHTQKMVYTLTVQGVRRKSNKKSIQNFV